MDVVEAVTNAVVLSRETNSTFFSSEWLVVSFVTVRLAYPLIFFPSSKVTLLVQFAYLVVVKFLLMFTDELALESL